jgi:hypothetical protein
MRRPAADVGLEPANMKNLRETSLSAALAALFALSSTGCSLLFVNERPSPRPGSLAPAAAKCTSSQVAPVLDTIFAGLEAARTVYAASADDSVYENPNQPLSRGTDVALGLGFTALFLGSSLYGYVATRNCRKYEKDSDDTSEHEWESEPAGVKRGSQQPARVAPPAKLDAPSSAEAEAEAEAAPSPAAATTAPDATAPTAPDTTDAEVAPIPAPAPPAGGKQ